MNTRSGEAYRSIDERCNACEVMGGDENPCLQASLLRALEEETGHPCPRRESFNADDDVCLELLVTGALPTTERLVPLLLDLECGEMPRPHRLQLVRRVAAASRDGRLAELLPRRMF